jgi:hypothetical protein
MRRIVPDQLPLVPQKIPHEHARELSQISAVLDELPEAAELVFADLVTRGGKQVDPEKAIRRFKRRGRSRLFLTAGGGARDARRRACPALDGGRP